MPPTPERRPSSEYGTCAACENAAAHDKLMQLSQPWNPFRRPTWQSAIVTTVGAFIIFLANQLTTLLVGFYPLYAQQSLGASEFQVSALFSIYPLCIMVACPSGSFLATRLGRNAVICLGLFVSGLSTIWFAYCDNVNLLVVLRGIQGFGAGMSIVGSVSMITEQATMTVTNAISITELVVAVAFVTAPAIGSVLYGWGGVSLPFLASGVAQLACLMIIPSLFVEYGLPDGLLFEVARPGAEPTVPLRFLDVLTPTSVVCLVVTTVAMGGFGLVDPTLGTHLQHSLGAQHTAIGIGFSVSALLYVAGDHAFAYLTMQCGCKPVILLGLTCLSISFMCLGVPSLAGVHDSTTALWSLDGIALVLFGSGTALAIAPGVPLSLTSLEQVNFTEARSLLIGLFGGAVYFGQAVGPWLAWSLSQVVPRTNGSPLPWVFTLYGLVLGVVWAYVFTCLPSGDEIQAKAYRRTFSLQRQVSEYGQFVSIDDEEDEEDEGDSDTHLLAFETGSYGSMSPPKPF
ncbi:hypothetical protein DYB25_002382 [Aphanomyces astaci]|uniref:Major facilitator superfamily (MFS) profile domain-containing protein n=2 Tax=Aphanomyces astaci TaxID=112090 RepID=A0A397C5X7_APHAT|nr:hypothetical protein DYB25_002382 [Aphanomyces astaci]RHY44201.1 hypothetical protein DYB34_007274 [Aphanomyces astaci]RHY63917.1 hypothetical protein DYB30_001479 [Aphanomyces astaci]RHZ26242.1 hypothetical protein DYB26_003242 [Aphanomyces astaci]